VTKQSLAPKWNPHRDGRIIVFIDESGLSERPTRVETWAPKVPDTDPAIQFQLQAVVGHRRYQLLALTRKVNYGKTYR